MKDNPAEKIPQAIAAVNFHLKILLPGKIFQSGNPLPEFAVRVDIGVVKPACHLVSLLAEKGQGIDCARAAADMKKNFHPQLQRMA
jgi:hypothetical protein